MSPIAANLYKTFEVHAHVPALCVMFRMHAVTRAGICCSWYIYSECTVCLATCLAARISRMHPSAAYAIVNTSEVCIHLQHMLYSTHQIEVCRL